MSPHDMVGRGLSCVKYTGSEKDEDFGELLKTKDMDADLAKVGASSCEDEFQGIIDWNDSIPTLFSTYTNWYETKDNNVNKSRMKITEAVNLGEPNLPWLDVHTKDYNNVKSVISGVERIELIEYLSSKDVSAFRSLLMQLRNTIHEKLTADVILKYAYQLADCSLERIKAHADKNSDTVSKPSSTGFREFAMGRLKLRKAIKTILTNLAVPEYNEREYLGELEEKGKIYINKRYRMLSSSSKTAEFGGGVTVMREIVQLLTTAHDKFFAADLATTLALFSGKCTDVKISSLKSFLGLSKQLVLESGSEYKPSNGEKGILLLQRTLGRDADAYFLDEPELGMGNSYIDTNIRPLISSLAKRHKVVVVATHNANIAVRTLPYTSIFRVHENGVYTTYVGNPFNDCLRNIENAEDVRSWTEECLHTLEGGEEAFYERKKIYESKNN